MAGFVDSYKKVYENKNVHIWLMFIAFIWTILSTLWDIKIGNPDTYKQNPVDVIFNFFVGAYSIQFLHNAINNINNGVIPNIKDICGKIYLGIIKLNIVWLVYAGIYLILTVILFIKTHYIILPVLAVLVLLFAAVFIYYIFLAYAEKLDTKGLFNFNLLFKFIKPAAKHIYLKLLGFIMICIAAFLIYLVIYIIAGLTGITKIGLIGNDYYIFDIITGTFVSYFVIITWYFAFPYSLINSYIEYIRPVIGKEENNGTDA